MAIDWSKWWEDKGRSATGNALSDLGSGMAQGGFDNMFSLASQRSDQLAPSRQAEALRVADIAEKQSVTNKTAEWLTSQGRTDLADAMKAGGLDGNEAMQAWMDSQQKPDPTANMQDFQFAQANPGFANFLNPQKAPDYPTSYDEFMLGQQNPDYAATLAKPGPAAGPMDATTKRELFEAEDASTAGTYVLSALDRAMELSGKAYDGPMAGARGAGAAAVGIGGGAETMELKNVTTELALTQLKAVFGAAPTEGERAILVELQGSVDQPKAVREAIFKRAKVMAERRIADAQAKAAGLRTGDYFTPGYGGGDGASDYTVIGVE